MQDLSNASNATSNREIVTTRIFDATPAQVFEAWSHSEHLEEWWGPLGFTTTTHKFDFRPGGGWTLTMHGPDGTDYPNRLVYDEIVAGERIVYSHHGGIDGVPAQFQQTVTFVKKGKQTELTMRLAFRTAAERDAVVQKYGAIEGGKQTLARLAEHIHRADTRPQFRTSRVFYAPRHLVFQAWSKAEHVSRWFTPAPLTTPQCELDFREGGRFYLVMRMPDGTEFPMDARYVEIVPNERIAFTAVIHGGVEIYTTISFTELDNHTQLDVHQIYSHESDATRGSPQGWNSTLNQLAQHLQN